MLLLSNIPLSVDRINGIADLKDTDIALQRIRLRLSAHEDKGLSELASLIEVLTDKIKDMDRESDHIRRMCLEAEQDYDQMRSQCKKYHEIIKKLISQAPHGRNCSLWAGGEDQRYMAEYFDPKKCDCWRREAESRV